MTRTDVGRATMLLFAADGVADDPFRASGPTVGAKCDD